MPREAVCHKLDMQMKVYAPAISNLSSTLALAKETAQELEELGLDGFIELDQCARDQIKIKMVLEIEKQALSELMGRVGRTSADQFSQLQLQALFEEKREAAKRKLDDEAHFNEKLFNEGEYIDFLKTAWQGAHQNEPFIPKRAWKILMKQPVEDDMEEDEDDDIAIVEEQISFICPFTTQMMDEVWKSKTCGHIFSSAVHNLLTTHRGRIECPVTGCDRYVTSSNVVKDAKLNRMLQRARVMAHDQHEDYVTV